MATKKGAGRKPSGGKTVVRKKRIASEKARPPVRPKPKNKPA